MFSEFLNIIRGDGSIEALLASLLAGVVILFFVLPFHELAHGFVANKLGDPTAKNMGRLTFNPLAHLDPIGAALLVLFGFGWAKPVPVNPYYFKKPKKDMAIVALAGPVANLIAALAGGLVYNLLYVIAANNYVAIGTNSILRIIFTFLFAFLGNYISINVVLAVFNLIPFPPLDGSRILSAFLSDSAYYKLASMERYFFIALILLMSTNVFSMIITVPVNFVFKGIIWLTGLPFSFFI